MGKDGRLLLHIGCGEIDRPYFTNVDARDLPHVHHVTQDIEDLSLIEDGPADLIYASHVIEHVGWRQQPELFTRFFNKLKPGGTLRLGTVGHWVAGLGPGGFLRHDQRVDLSRANRRSHSGTDFPRPALRRCCRTGHAAQAP